MTDIDSLRLELEATRHNRDRDVTLLLNQRDEARADVERLKQQCAEWAADVRKTIAAHDALDLQRLKQIQDLDEERRDEKAAVEAMASAIEKHLPGFHPVQSPDEGIHVLAEQRDEAKRRAEDAEVQLAAALEELAKARKAAP